MTIVTCPRCSGVGRLPFTPNNGVCYLCKGNQNVNVQTLKDLYHNMSSVGMVKINEKNGVYTIYIELKNKKVVMTVHQMTTREQAQVKAWEIHFSPYQYKVEHYIRDKRNLVFDSKKTMVAAMDTKR